MNQTRRTLLPSRLSPLNLAVAVGCLAAAAIDALVVGAVVIVVYELGGTDALTGQISSQSARWWLSDAVHTAIVETMNVGLSIGAFGAVIFGLAAGLTAYRIRRDQLEARGLHDVVEAEVWRAVAEEAASNVDRRYLIKLVEAAPRLLGSSRTEIAPLFGGKTDQLPDAARTVRVYGPIGSGKTVCGRRLVEQEVEAGRHVTVIHSGNTSFGGAEYEFHDVAAEKLTVVDAETLMVRDAQRAFVRQFDRRNDRKNGVSRGGETIIVDADGTLDGWGLRQLIIDLANMMISRHQRLVVLTTAELDPPVLSGLFDAEIVLPGAPDCPNAVPIRHALHRLSNDALTLERLEARVRGGGVVMSRPEQAIMERISEHSREYLAERVTRTVEEGMPITAGLQHGIIKSPDGTLKEFTLATVSTPAQEAAR